LYKGRAIRDLREGVHTCPKNIQDPELVLWQNRMLMGGRDGIDSLVTKNFGCFGVPLLLVMRHAAFDSSWFQISAEP